ncbi:MAG TPA: hypothetical protein VJU61_01715 [Polyangiaceae bacterium]|nr:hypothetical protein [Polyangiaceae bacterium]
MRNESSTGDDCALPGSTEPWEATPPVEAYAQLRALEELGAQARATARPLAVGFEMFQRPFQPRP